MGPEPLIESFEVEMYFPAQWTQSFEVSWDAASGEWTLWEERTSPEGVSSDFETYETASELVDGLTGTLLDYAARESGFIDHIKIAPPPDGAPQEFLELLDQLRAELFGGRPAEGTEEAIAAGWRDDGKSLVADVEGMRFRIEPQQSAGWRIAVLSPNGSTPAGGNFAGAADAMEAATLYARAVGIQGVRGPIDMGLRGRLLRPIRRNDRYQATTWKSPRQDLSPYVFLDKPYPAGWPVRFLQPVAVPSMNVSIPAGTEGTLAVGWAPDDDSMSVRLKERRWAEFPPLEVEAPGWTARIMSNQDPPYMHVAMTRADADELDPMSPVGLLET